MTTWLLRWFACLMLLLPFIPVIASDPNDAEIARLVKQLGDDEFERREAAATRLVEIGEPAFDAVTKATTSGDPEVRRRAKDLVAVLEDKRYPEHQLRHTGWVWHVSVSADGKRLLTGSTDATLRLWDTHTGKELRSFTGHTGWVTDAALSPDGKRVLSGSSDMTVRLWDATTGKELHKMTGHTGWVLAVCFGPEGKALSTGPDGTLHLWDLDTGKEARALTIHTGKVRTVAYSDQAKLAATGGEDDAICLWNLGPGKEVRKLTGHGGFVSSVRFSPDGKRLLSANGAMMRIWDVASGKELKQIPDADVCCVAFSPDGKRVVTAGCRGRDNTVRLWDLESGQELRRYEGHTDCVSSVAFFPDGQRIASASEDRTVRIWRAPR